MPIVIGFEGKEGVGKSIVSEAIQKSVGGVCISNRASQPRMVEERSRVNSRRDIEDRFKYFVLLNGMQMAEARAMHTDVVTLDSTIYRTSATHRVLGSQLAQQFSLRESLVPDLTVVLDLDEHTRLQRLHDLHGSVSENHWDELLNHKAIELEAEYDTFNLQHIDASLPIDVVVQKVLELAGLAVVQTV
jgi:thymidylate kinase